MDAVLKANSIAAIDIVRFYAIALVFYGHFIEELMLPKNPAAASQSTSVMPMGSPLAWSYPASRFPTEQGPGRNTAKIAVD